MTGEEIENEAIDTIQEIAAMAALHVHPDNPGATQIAIVITAYSKMIGGLLYEGMISLDEALSCTSADLDVIHAALREIAAKKAATP